MGYTPTPESELTEEQVRKWFNNLRVLYQEALHRIHEVKLQKRELSNKIFALEHQNSVLRKENKSLKAWWERKPMKEKKVWNWISVKSDFKKKFFDGL